MKTSFLFHAFGLKGLECNRIEYKGKQIIFHVHYKDRKISCPQCGERTLVKNGYRIRDFVGVPIGTFITPVSKTTSQGLTCAYSPLGDSQTVGLAWSMSFPKRSIPMQALASLSQGRQSANIFKTHYDYEEDNRDVDKRQEC